MSFEANLELLKAFNLYRESRESYSIEERKKILATFDEKSRRINSTEAKGRPLTPLEQHLENWSYYREIRESYSIEERKKIRRSFSEEWKNIFK